MCRHIRCGECIPALTLLLYSDTSPVLSYCAIMSVGIGQFYPLIEFLACMAADCKLKDVPTGCRALGSGINYSSITHDAIVLDRIIYIILFCKRKVLATCTLVAKKPGQSTTNNFRIYLKIGSHARQTLHNQFRLTANGLQSKGCALAADSGFLVRADALHAVRWLPTHSEATGFALGKELLQRGAPLRHAS